MSDCEHDLAERETACADGLCPLCLSADMSALEAKLAEAQEHHCNDMLASIGQLDEIAERTVRTLPRVRENAREAIRAALDEAVAEERKALREIAEKLGPVDYAADDEAGGWNACRQEFLTALDARSSQGSEKP